MPVLDGRKKGDKDSEFTRYIPVPKNPHGCNTSSDGKYFIANGKLSPTVTMIEIAKLPDLFAGKLKDPRDTVAAEVELGLGRCTPPSTVAATPTPRRSSTAVVKWNMADAVRAYKGEKVEYIKQKLVCTTSRATFMPRSAKPAKPTASGWWRCASSPDRFLSTGPLHPENDQLIDISGDVMKLVHDGPTYAEPHDCIMARRDQIKTKKIWDRNDPSSPPPWKWRRRTASTRKPTTRSSATATRSAST